MMTVVCKSIPLLDVYVYFIDSFEDAKAFILEHSATEDEEKQVERARGACHTVTDADGHDHRIMCVFDGDLDTVIHEAVHMARITLKHCNIKWSPANDEPLAFTAAWLGKEMAKIIGGSI